MVTGVPDHLLSMVWALVLSRMGVAERQTIEPDRKPTAHASHG